MQCTTLIWVPWYPVTTLTGCHPPVYPVTNFTWYWVTPGTKSVFPDDFLKNLYRLKKSRTFLRHGYQITGLCKYY